MAKQVPLIGINTPVFATPLGSSSLPVEAGGDRTKYATGNGRGHALCPAVNATDVEGLEIIVDGVTGFLAEHQPFPPLLRRLSKPVAE